MEKSIKKDADKLGLLVKDVIAKKELSNLDQEFVKEKVNTFLEKHRKTKEKIITRKYSEFKRSKEYKELLKKIRADLREIYGVFILKDYKKRDGLLENLKKQPSIENHNKILDLHKSSKERLPYYGLIYKKIFKLTGLPKKIIDLACGLNPFSYKYITQLGCKPEYIACDLAKKDLDFIKEYFRAMKIKGKSKKIDLIKDNISKTVPKAEVVFLFKALDSLETVKRNISEKIISNLPAKFIVVSFSTQSLGGKKAINKDRRSWFERLVKKLNYKMNIFEIPGEIFYIITKL